MVVGIGGLIFWRTRKMSAEISARLALQKSQAEADLKSQTTPVAGDIVQPASGFPNGLLIEPLIKPIVNESAVSADGKTVTAKRSYISSFSMDVAYNLSENYLKGKSWQITELTAKNPAQEKSFEAKKYNYDATLVFAAGDGENALVTITVTSPTK